MLPGAAGTPAHPSCRSPFPPFNAAGADWLTDADKDRQQAQARPGAGGIGPMTRPRILKVAVDAPLFTLFDYKVPKGGAAARPGCRVRVPFGKRRVIGLVMETASRSELPPGKLRPAEESLDREPVLGPDDLWLLRFTAGYYHHPIGEVAAAALPALVRQGRSLAETEQVLARTERGREVDVAELGRRAPRQAELMALLEAAEPRPADALDELMPTWRRVVPALTDKGWVALTERATSGDLPTPTEPVQGPRLNDEQRRALETIGSDDGFSVTLLDGVTGSGKTEVYLRIMRDVLDAGRQVLVLVPEIGLTPQIVARLESRLGAVAVLFHSGLTDRERFDAWRQARDGRASVIIGTRSAVFVPLARPGLIVVDEEHDTSFKQQEGLRYSARDLAVARAKRLDLPVILGSATPSLDSLRQAGDGHYRVAGLSERAGGALPPHLRLIDLNRFRNDDGVSPPLADAIRTHLAGDGQALVFLNRRGFAPTLVCRDCGHIAECRRCDSRMTVHRHAGQLSCHHCGASRALDTHCSDCGGQVLPLGEGTERIEDGLAERFPDALIRRIDSDTMRPKGALEEALAMATSGEARILVGTQMLSKGHHFPKLTLVGVVNADQGLFSTDFRGAERLAQRLVQVAGRAGRERRQGEVLIQTSFPQHRFWSELFSGGYSKVAGYSLEERRTAGWPPWSRLALIRASAHQREHTVTFLERIAAAAAHAAEDLPGIRILGPVSAPMERRAGRYRGQLLLQAAERAPLHALLTALETQLESDAASKRVRWSIDVDPAELF